jgi:hypothetical protein
MIKYLEEILREKTKDSESEILLAQWNYDKKVIPAALQSVSNLFPHYSLHDETHSITIINNIVRVLGKEIIHKLSAIDIWLILEASYSHDIGIVVSGEKLSESLNSPKFLEFFKELIQDNKNGLHEFAIQFQIVDNQIRQNDNLLNLELNDGIKFILAEYFRRIHAERSEEIISNPTSEISLSSPRSVIPPRIFKMLGNICSCHTKGFKDVMKLPFCQVGIDLEDAHPRFIACLLRVGDLLDLDNNRFSEVMLRTLSKVPIDTLNHKAKHLSINLFRVDKDVIEITAQCKDYDTANITQHWFNYLNSEISNQMINWNQIVPFRELGYLPTIGNLKVDLLNYDLIDGKNKPKFSVDTDKALGLLRGAGIYDGAYQSIREILQNATDSTLIRIWVENKVHKDFSTPHTEDFLQISSDYPITVNIEDQGLTGEFKNWKIEIEDKGIGISTHDLKFLMNTGSSSKNTERQSVIDGMPVWMRPSGTFGIGFQSVFMLTDSVKIETKSFQTEEFQTIELYSPNSTKDGDILIQKKKTSHLIKPGAKLTLNHKTKAIPESYSIKSGHETASRIAHNFDPFSHKSMDIELGKILDEILNFASKSYFPIKLMVNDEEIETNIHEGEKFTFFEEHNNIELNIYPDVHHYGARFNTYYKNQKVENNLRFDFLGFDINIHSEKASEILTLNRNKIQTSFQETLLSQVLYSSYKIITQNFDEIFDTDEAKMAASMFLNYYDDELEELKEFNAKKFNNWQNFQIVLSDQTTKSLIELINSVNKLTIIHDYNPVNRNNTDEYQLNGDELTLKFVGARPSSDYTRFYLSKTKENFTSVTRTKKENNIRTIYYTKEIQKSVVPNDDIQGIVKNLLNDYPVSARAIIPCIEEYFDLRIKDGVYAPYVHHYFVDDNIYLSFPKMLSPFVREEVDKKKSLKVVVNDKVIDWVYENRFNSDVSKETIKEKYKSFCELFNLDEINRAV